MAKLNKLEIECSIEAVVQKELMKVAEKIYKDHGLIISDISFEWLIRIGDESTLLGCETRSSSRNT